ncbi:MAG: S9 family peptidase [Sphingomonadaceae bacterium]|nr:S9 family peptidase [Sphingomonadaceae bacterium]
MRSSPFSSTRILAALCASAALTAIATPAAARQMTADDLATLPRLAAPAASPDGRWVVYQQTDTDPQSYARTTGLWVVSTAGGEPVRIADIDGANENSAAFSPDGRRLYFLSNKSGKDQIWFVDIAADGSAGAPVQASDTLADIAGFSISPTGSSILIWGDIAQNCATFGCEGNGDTATAGPGSGRVYDQMFVRHWDQWETPGVYARPFVAPIGADGKFAAAPHAIGVGPVGDTPTKPFGGGEDLAWSRDGQTIYFTRRLADRHEPTSTNLDIYSAPAAGGDPVNLTAANQATDTLATPSPDGRTLAYVAMARPGYEADRQVLMLRDLRNGTVRALTQNWDRSVDSIVWAADSRSLYVTAQDTLQHPLFQVDARSGNVTRLTDRGSVGNVQILPSGALLYVINSITEPPALVLRARDGQTRRIADPAGARMAGIDPMRYEIFSFTGANGDTVWGQTIVPANAPAGHLPTVLLVHGGPQGSFGNSWSTRWNPMLFAAPGNAVITIDFHGSTGYGQAFTDSINRNWGGWPLEDLRLGMTAAAAANPAVDPANACAAGGSYGGYMMNWIAGNWPDGFKCLITHAGVFDLRAMALETEELWFDEWENGGPWWSRPDAERWNPVNHIQNWRTPTLVIHGERDFRIPYTQGLAAFTALQRQGIESRLLIYPDENHWILRGRNSVQWYREVLGWIAGHTRR